MLRNLHVTKPNFRDRIKLETNFQLLNRIRSEANYSNVLSNPNELKKFKINCALLRN